MTALVSEQTYRNLTGDLRSPVGDVTAALAVAQGLVEVRLGRALGLGEYTETLKLYPTATVYPSVTPLDPTQTGYLDSVTMQAPISSYPITDIVGATTTAQIWQSSRRAVVTYTGGYTAETLPQPLQTGISLVAKHLMTHPDASMAGIKSYTEGDIAATYDKPLDTVWPAGVWEIIRRYAHREAVSA